jgi:ankyrin repeat protein
LREVLQSVADVLFPGDEEEREIAPDSCSSEGDTPLHVLAWRKDVEGARILIAAGADVNAVGDMDQTPLHVAIAQRDMDFVRLLLESGARTTTRSEFGKTELDEAAEKGGAVEELVRRYS